jgi:hypothetical protein
MNAMPRSSERGLVLAVLLVLLQACAGTEAERCMAMPERVIATHGRGAEDIVALPLGGDATRLFVREVSRGWPDSRSAQNRIGRVDIGPGLAPRATELAWRPPEGWQFKPLGMSLTSNRDFLFVLDRVEPVRIWRLAIVDGEIVPATQPWFTDEKEQLSDANDLQAVGPDTAFVTRFDGLPWRPGTWHGVVRVFERDGERRAEALAHTEGLRGANGIVELGDDLIVADHRGRRLLRVGKGPETGIRPATAELPVQPDNLTLDGPRILIAGQYHLSFTVLNLLASAIPSPSAVLAIGAGELGPEASPRMLWQGGWSHGRSVSVAVPAPGGLILGQISAPDLLQVACAAR